MNEPLCSNEKGSNEAGSKVATTSVTDPALANYIKVVDEEKQEWKSFVKNLQKEYYELKRDVVNGTKFSLENFNYEEYLTNDELEFLTQVRQARDDHISVQSSIKDLKGIICLAKQKLKEHETFLRHLSSISRTSD